MHEAFRILQLTQSSINPKINNNLKMSSQRTRKFLLCTIPTVLILGITVYFPLARDIESVFPLLFIPAVLWGVFFGFRAGIISGGFFSLYTFLFIVFVLKEKNTLPYVIIAGVLLISVSYIVGKLSDLYRKTKKQEEEYKLLLRELHHRVKNNLNIMANIVYLQSETVSNGVAKTALQETYSRIMGMFDIYNELYRTEGHTHISTGPYLQNIKKLYEDKRIEINIQSDTITVDSETAVALGIITNECITNAAKYAFPDGRSGNVSIRLEKANGSEVVLSVSDNGVGLPKNFSLENSESFGFNLVKTLAEQLRGSLSIESKDGTAVIVRFPAAAT
jgi:two-component sensor histidine kinase